MNNLFHWITLFLQSLIPYVDDAESNKPDLKKKSDSYKQYSEEVAELREVGGHFLFVIFNIDPT